MRCLVVACAALALAACAADSGQDGDHAAGAATLRAQPSDRAMTRAFARVSDDVVRCIRADLHTVTVAGAFDGATGAFRVERVAGVENAQLPPGVDACVRAAAERARVRPFRDRSAVFAYTFAGPMNVAATHVSHGAQRGADGGVAGYRPAVANAPLSRPVIVGGGGGGGAGGNVVASQPQPADLVRREGDALQRCYEQACERDHTVSGTIELRITLDSAGRIVNLTSDVATTNHDDVTLMGLVARCVESHVRLITFGPQSNPGLHTLSLAFHPGGIQ